MREVVGVLAVLGLLVVSAHGETLLSSLAVGSAAIKNVDNHGSKNIRVEDQTDGSVFIRIDTMPDRTDPNAADDYEENLLVFPYMNSLSETPSIRVRFTYEREKDCPTYTHPKPVQCSESLTIYLFSALQSDDSSILMAGPHLAKLTLTGGLKQTTNFDEYVSLPANTPGVRMILEDQGSDFNVVSFFVDRYKCTYNNPPRTLELTCPDVFASHTSNVSVSCTCAAHSLPSTITKYCVLDESSHSAGFLQPDSTTCTCDPDYEYTAGAGNDRFCKLKSTLSPSTTTTPKAGQPTTPKAGPTTTPKAGQSSTHKAGQSSTPGSGSQSTPSSQSTKGKTGDGSHASTNHNSWFYLLLYISLFCQTLF